MGRCDFAFIRDKKYNIFTKVLSRNSDTEHILNLKRRYDYDTQQGE